MKRIKTPCIFVMALMMTNLPHFALAEKARTVSSMIPTSSIVADLTRDQAKARVDDFLQRSDVRQQLLQQGLSNEEVSLRVAALSETELKQLALQVEQGRAGGDILVTILLIILIIFLVKRI